MKIFFILLLAGSCGILRAQTNAPAQTPPEPKTEISSDTFHFDGIKNQMIYLGHVFVTDNVKAKLHCEQLTVDLPPDFGHPTNIVAETDVVIDMLDEKGQTNHITADKAVYIYSVVNAVTNEVVTFTGGNPTPKVENPQFTATGDPLVLNLVTKQFSGLNYRTFFKQPPTSGNGTNSPMKLF
jgi:lipopolysaccharide export system protein LptA